MMRTHGGRVDRALTPSNDIAAIANEQVIYALGENCRNPSRGAKHQRDLLRDYFNHIGALAKQVKRIWGVTSTYPGDR